MPADAFLGASNGKRTTADSMLPMPQLDCTLCSGPSRWFAEDRRRAYFRCAECELIFADPASRLDPAAEKAVYDQHENDPADARYRRFLNQLAEPLLARLTPDMRGIDYGCGPGPTLSVMLEEAGMEMAIYDPYFAPDTSVLNQRYDFVTCTEVVEHFCDPANDWARMSRLLRRGGWLGVMTKLLEAPEGFNLWHYKNDPTHVSFYSPATLAWLAARHGMSIELEQATTFLFLKR